MGDGGDAPLPKIYGGGWLYYHPPIRMVNLTADKTAACVLLRKQRNVYAFSISLAP